MTPDDGDFVGERVHPPRGLPHRAWLVAAVTLAALVAAAAFRSSTGVLLEPVESEFGWSRATTSGAVSLNLVLYGLTAPFAAAFMERFGVRRTVAVALVLVGLSSAATTVMTSAWQLWLLWGVLIGIGTGAMALVLGAVVANRWFERHRGLVTGIFSAANATGQLLFLPVIARAAAGPGWRWAAGVVAVLALLVAVLVALLLTDHPHDRGLLPYGATAAAPPAAASTESPARRAVSTLVRVSRRWPFWALVLTFWVCGWSTNGIIQTHFVPAAHDHGMPATTAAGLLAVVGVFDIAGTVGSGWLTDRVDPRLLLAGYYAGRGLSLLALDAVLAPGVEPGMWVFIVFYGLDWVATVPPTVALCRTHFGVADSGVVFGWVFASHMVGAGVGASVAGWVRTAQGDYHWAWVGAAVLCFAAVALALAIPRRPVREQEPVLSPLG
ncbi:MFS transporter [Phycicoccus sp. MAQZ13P-2]|uniref:MFS transporter n=1 Tax=Phycicoccus mangrovi TaxID=2840470 RepID=UPI001C0081A6|nr:MFS transporter [Phycicoccus mangrovi]MBT9256462.1 MFS transporter [Phycicoccus mangrovi]MBT9275111.1 MFS transporter [Phycicoccus mangrovi]